MGRKGGPRFQNHHLRDNAAQNRESRIARFPESPAWNRQKFRSEKNKNQSKCNKLESRKIDSESPSELHPINAQSDLGIARFESHDSWFRIADSVPLSLQENDWNAWGSSKETRTLWSCSVQQSAAPTTPSAPQSLQIDSHHRLLVQGVFDLLKTLDISASIFCSSLSQLSDSLKFLSFKVLRATDDSASFGLRLDFVLRDLWVDSTSVPDLRPNLKVQTILGRHKGVESVVARPF